jgi:hypothetical protein
MPPQLRARPEVVAGLPDPASEPLPRRVGAFQLLGALMQAGLPNRVVPEQWWTRTKTEDGFDAVEIACPCGHRPIVELAAYPTQCQCQRWFFYAGPEVLSLNGLRE